MHVAEVASHPNKEEDDDSEEGFRFDKSLQELRDLRSQLQYAADYCETTFLNSEEKKAVVENTKDYICKAVVIFADHLGNVSANLNHCICKTNAFSEAELRIDCLKQRLLACEQFADTLALTRVKWNPILPKHHRRYLSAHEPSLSKRPLLRSNFNKYNSDSTLVPVRDGLLIPSKGSNPTFHFQQENKKLVQKSFYRKPLQSADILSLIRRARRSAA
ncbi:hypothetical protein DITRI_Ditri03aG0065700 [Diplodiscus trichospermus]